MKFLLKNIILPAVLLAAVYGAGAAAPEDMAFGAGEKLTYMASYKVGPVNADVAEITLNTEETTLGGKDVFRITGVGRTTPFYRWFYDVNDVYVSNLDRQTLKPVDLTVEISEEKYRHSSYLGYDWSIPAVNSRWRNHTRMTTPDSLLLPIPQNSADPLAMFYNLRSRPLESFTQGQNEYLDVILTDTVRRMYFVFLGRETKNVRGVGKFKTLKFKAQIVTGSDESFTDGSEFFLWITDDKNKIPVYLESPIRVGSVRVSIVKYEGLKHPLDSKK